jgi:hypothetical protein
MCPVLPCLVCSVLLLCSSATVTGLAVCVFLKLARVHPLWTCFRPPVVSGAVASDRVGTVVPDSTHRLHPVTVQAGDLFGSAVEWAGGAQHVATCCCSLMQALITRHPPACFTSAPPPPVLPSPHHILPTLPPAPRLVLPAPLHPRVIPCLPYGLPRAFSFVPFVEGGGYFVLFVRLELGPAQFVTFLAGTFRDVAVRNVMWPQMLTTTPLQTSRSLPEWVRCACMDMIRVGAPYVKS